MTEGWPPGTSEQNVQQVIGQYGTLTSVRMAASQGPNPAFLIQMARPDQAKWLVDNLNRNIPLGLTTPISVRHHAEPDADGHIPNASGVALVAKSAPPKAPWAAQPQGGGGYGPCGFGGPMGAPQAPMNSQMHMPNGQMTQACGMPGAVGGPGPAVSNKLYVEKLPPSLTEDMVRQVFGQYGSLAAVNLLGDNGEGSLSAHIVMNDISQAKWLVDNLHRNIPVGLAQPVHVSYAQQDEAIGKAMCSATNVSPGPYGSLPPPPPPPPAAGGYGAMS